MLAVQKNQQILEVYENWARLRYTYDTIQK